MTSVLLVVSVFEAPRIVVKSYHRHHSSVCFSADGYRCARRIATEIPDDGLIANFWYDGSPWASMVSGRPFYLPCS
ncbi:MAG: hypothetical protein ABIF77_07820 [bacterium]